MILNEIIIAHLLCAIFLFPRMSPRMPPRSKRAQVEVVLDTINGETLQRSMTTSYTIPQNLVL